ncbi:MAG: flagellar hook-length control protein FliK [Candidatus Kryptonium sp.]
MAKQLNAFMSNQESGEVGVSSNSTLEPFFSARGGEVLELLQSLNLKDKINLNREIRKFIVRGETKEVGLDEAIRKFVVANGVKYGDVKGGEIDLKLKSVFKKDEKVDLLKLEGLSNETAAENDIKIFKAELGRGLNENDRINAEGSIFRSEKPQSQLKNQEHNVDVKNKGGDVVLANFERDQAKNEFDLHHDFKKFELGSVKFEKVYEKVGNWNLNFIDTLDVGDKAKVRNFTISVKSHEVPDVVRALVSKNGDFVHREVVLRVEPEEIGRIVIKISQGESGVKILFEVKNFEAKQLIESGFGNLKATLESSNVTLEKIGVLLVSENPNGNYFDSSSSERGQFLKRTSKRKIFDSFETVKLYGGSLIEAII